MESNITKSIGEEKFKSFLLIAFTQAIAFISNFVNLFILTRLFPPEEYGVYQFSLTFLAFFTIFANFGMSTTIIQQLSAEKNKDSRKFVYLISEGFKIIFIFTIIFSSVLFLLSDVFEQVYRISGLSIILKYTSLYLFSINLINYFESIYQGLWHFKSFAISFSLAKIIRTFIVLLTLIFNMTIINVVALFSLTSLIQFIIMAFFIQKQHYLLSNLKKSEEVIIKNILRFSVFIFLYVFFQNLVTNSNQFILALFIQPDELAYYTIVIWIMTSLSIPALIFSRFVLPHVSHYIQEEEGAEKKNVELIFNMVFKYGLFITIPVSFCIFYFSDFIVIIIFNPSYYPISTYLKFFIFYLNITMIDVGGGHFLWASNEPKLVYKLYGITLILTIILSLLLIPVYLIYGAIISIIIPHTIYVLYSIVLVKKRNNITFEPKLPSTLVKYIFSGMILIICIGIISVFIKLDFSNIIILGFIVILYFGSFLMLNILFKAIRISEIKDFINTFKSSFIKR